ncbi:MAG: hypothetical protein WBQ37_17750, partial [Candidatus Competibacter sp.]
ALSQLYVLDTCHAGGLDYVISGLYDARISVLAHKMGLHLFAGTSSLQNALDGYQGNGLFTHTLLTGLRNNPAADSNKDHAVSIAELGAFSKDYTKIIGKTIHFEQTPLIVNFGQDQLLYRLLNSNQ